MGINQPVGAFRPNHGPDPHRARTKHILEQHPEIRNLIGPSPWSFIFIVLLVAVQLGIAYLVQDYPIWVGIGLAACGGVIPALGLYFLLHECAHDLVFHHRRWNWLAGIFANSVNTFPIAVPYSTHHVKHHSSLGDSRADQDMPTAWEANLVGHSPWRKWLWLLFNPLFQLVRCRRLNTVRIPRGWLLLNTVVVVGVDIAVLCLMGPTALLYLFCSYFFAMGLPLGAFWIPEHFTLEEGQETYSYYGALNFLFFNRGYHTEHHDFPSIPWNRLPQVRKIAPEWYDNLPSHRSYFGAMMHFLFRRDVTLFCRTDRTPTEGAKSEKIPR